VALGEIAVMGAEGAVNIVYRRELSAAAKQSPKRWSGAPREDRRISRPFREPFVAAENGFVDDVIEPRQRVPA